MNAISKSADVTYRELGRTGIYVYPIGLGAMPLSMRGRPAEAHAMQVIQAALDEGMNFIDTANVYCIDETELGHNERLISKALDSRGMKKTVTVATKGGVNKRERRVDGRPEFLRESCIKSLEDLECEAITLYQLHAPDERVPLEDSVGELSRLQEEGKILHVGLSNVTTAELRRAQSVARVESVENGSHPFNSADYNGAMLIACEEDGVSFLAHSPIGGKPHCESIVTHPVLVGLGKEYRVSPYALILAWHLAKGTRIIPIPGATRPESVMSSASAARLKLSLQDIDRVDALAA